MVFAPTGRTRGDISLVASSPGVTIVASSGVVAFPGADDEVDAGEVDDDAAEPKVRGDARHLSEQRRSSCSLR